MTSTTLNKRSYTCAFDNCDTTFTQLPDLIMHQLHHTGEKPYVCGVNDCTATFPLAYLRAIHRRHDHAGEKLHVCDVENCNAAFAKSSNLTKHRRTHTGEKPYVCDAENCNAAFATSSNLTNHRRVHTGEKPYVCDVDNCNAAFAESSALTNHRRTHTGEKPYVCDAENCNAAFITSSNLTIHRRTHTGELPYECPDPMCDQRFARTDTRDRHVKAFHSEEAELKRRVQEARIERLFHANDIGFEREKHISYSCFDSSDKHRAKLDFVVPTDRAVFIVEVDEHEHNTWSYTVLCDLARMAHVETALAMTADPVVGKQPTVWIRYNPDTFRVDGATVRTTKRDREAALLRILAYYVPERPTTIMYLYYACVSDSSGEWGRPTILDDDDYSNDMTALVDIMTQRRLDALR